VVGGGSEGPMNPATTVGQPPVFFCNVTQQILPAGGGSFIFACACMCCGCWLAAEERERYIPVCACHLSSRLCRTCCSQRHLAQGVRKVSCVYHG